MRRPVPDSANTAASLALVVLSAVSGSARSAAEVSATSDWLARDTLTGDWGGGRTWLQDRGVILEPRLSQFYQGLSAGDGDNSHDYGGKADLRMKADLARLGAWDGISMVIHAEYNFGTSANGRGGVMIPINTALYTPGMDGGDAFDISSFYFIQALRQQGFRGVRQDQHDRHGRRQAVHGRSRHRLVLEPYVHGHADRHRAALSVRRTGERAHRFGHVPTVGL